jgi:hypothetical protein
MNAARWFWWLLTMACVIWYSTITVYVAIRGSFDIRNMLSRLKNGSGEDNATDDRCA